MEHSIERANQYVEEHFGEINMRYRAALHAMPPVGWINDPNGFCFYRGQYHLFGQYHPYSTEWGPMHWAHWVSDDLVDWKWLGVCMAPDQEKYDARGVFSGSALVEGDLLTVMYTGVSFTPEGEERQQQCIAQSTDGIHFTKFADNPVIPSALLPEGADPANFRDPKLFRAADGYRAVMASKGKDGGQLLVYRSEDLHHWALAGVFASGVGEMLECPDYHVIDGKDTLISCVMSMPNDGLKYPSNNPVAYLLGKTNEDKTAFELESMAAIDNGLDYYAPQVITSREGKFAQTGWLNGWCSGFPTHKLGHGWCGCMSFPREMRAAGGKILQTPWPAIADYRADEKKAEKALAAKETYRAAHAASAEIKLVIRPNGNSKTRVTFFENGGEQFILSYDPAGSVMTMERGKCGYDMRSDRREETFTQAYVPLRNGELHLDILLDVCTAEVFLQDGEVVMSAMVHPKAEQYEYSVCCENGGQMESTVWALRGKAE